MDKELQLLVLAFLNDLEEMKAELLERIDQSRRNDAIAFYDKFEITKTELSKIITQTELCETELDIIIKNAIDLVTYVNMQMAARFD